VKIVAVSQRVDHFLERNETRDALDQRLAALGGTIRDWLTIVHPAAVVLSGGNDIGQCPKRDDIEDALLTYAQERHIPVLGVCRGMQMMAHWAGTGLYPVQGHLRTRHLLSGEITGEVNSYHGFSLAGCPTDFEVLARSEDDEIEAIRHQSLPWEGWMWHPEREATFAERDIQRLKALFL
jgi:putative glutamine amidotransferase